MPSTIAAQWKLPAEEKAAPAQGQPARSGPAQETPRTQAYGQTLGIPTPSTAKLQDLRTGLDATLDADRSRPAVVGIVHPLLHSPNV
eukprot:COSAG02_NODE_2081_length_9898_cov_45.797539_7_plen_87_part_00